MPKAPKERSRKREIENYAHADKERVNNPPVGLVTPETDKDAAKKTYAHDPHIDPQLSWAGKAEHTSFEVPTVSLHVHERVDPRTIIEAVRKRNGSAAQTSLFEAPEENPPIRQAIDFYRHRHNWSNRLVAGDSLLVMNSLLEKEGLGGQVQMVYIDPPYGTRYGSNFQPFVNNRDVTDGKDEDLTQEPETIRAFRDTWELGIHSYLTYLRDRLLLARELLTESGCCFVQMGKENVHRAAVVLDEPQKHWRYDRTTRLFDLIEGRRPAGYVVASEDSRSFDDPGVFVEIPLVNAIRARVKAWCEAGHPGVSSVTRRLLKHWHERDESEQRLFFCQLEAMETLIWLAEAPNAEKVGINVPSDGGPFERVCAKMATGSGKTIVMAMVIAWQVLNKVAQPQDKRFSRNVLVVAPGLTVKSRLAVLQPSAPGNYFEAFNVVPAALLDRLRQGRVRVCNWHALNWETGERVARRRSVDKRGAKSDEAYVRDVLGEMARAKDVLVLNDEAHHAWRVTGQGRTRGVARDEVETATKWIGGLDRIHRARGVLRCYDFSATPFAPTGGTSSEGALFDWIVSDFGLNDAIEAGLVKTPRVVVRDDAVPDAKTYKSRLYHIYNDSEVKDDLNRKAGPTEPLPDLVRNGYYLLGYDWRETARSWEAAGLATRPTMITVANRTETAARVKHAFDSRAIQIDELCDPQRTLHIDSKVLTEAEAEAEAGDDALGNGKPSNARERAEFLRRQVDTVGQPGQPGGGIQNVISVGMLSEGWDAKTVTHIMGLRAFASQLLCEQVVGRGLRRTAYEVSPETGLFEPEYVNVFGVPFTFLPHEEPEEDVERARAARRRLMGYYPRDPALKGTPSPGDVRGWVHSTVPRGPNPCAEICKLPRRTVSSLPSVAGGVQAVRGQSRLTPLRRFVTQTAFELTPRTSEERRVAAYGSDEPTQPARVRPTTPLEDLNLNWTERQLPELERTKHVHRLHPYLGKYIPQLVEVFVRRFLKSGMTVLDPFAGSGTTLVQANELGVNAIGYDISAFNVLMSNVKTARYTLSALRKEVMDVVDKTARCTAQPSQLLWNKPTHGALRTTDNGYLNSWFAPRALDELLAFRSLIAGLEFEDFLKLVLCRAARSARLTTHFDLDFPKAPTTQPYWCYKHSRNCEPTQTAFKFLSRHAADGLRRVEAFSQRRTDAHVECINADSRTASIDRVDGVITSPPYVGLIDYHEQHRYAYELLGLADRRDKEIGSADGGQSKAAQRAYVSSMQDVLRNVASSVVEGGPIVIVAADRFGLYGDILQGLPLSCDSILKRHVNRRTGRRSGEFYESIFVCTKQTQVEQ